LQYSKIETPFDYVRWHHHRHCHRPFFTQLVAAGTVVYPVYRLERYKTDYRSPTFIAAALVVSPAWWWFW